MYTQLVCLNLYLTVSVAPDSLHPHKNETRWFTGDGPSRLLHANLLWYPWGADFHERGEKLVIGREAVKRRLIGVDPWTLQQKKRALGLLWIKFHKPAVRAGPEWTLSPTIPLFYQYNCVLHCVLWCWSGWATMMNDGGAGGSSKVIKSWTRAQNNTHSTTEVRRWYYLHSVHVGRRDSYPETEPSRAASCSAMLMGLSFCPTCL